MVYYMIRLRHRRNYGTHITWEHPHDSVEKSFSDVGDDLNFGGLINFWGRYDRFVFSGDIMYVDTRGGHGRGPLPALKLPGFGITIPPGVSVDTEQFMVTMQGGYRVVDTPQFTLDVLAGVRFWYISNGVRVMASHSVIGTCRASHGEDFGRGCRDKLTLAVSAQIPISYGRRWRRLIMSSAIAFPSPWATKGA